ncbi:uncharacterized protein N7515_008928 [Penicillium bovifimosum]|uniref:Uncharacterized protein n=1 Tax=Penicillium bovifimosum TaxID=126998 RepID=A0A9W9KV08_9EURO|nr:uncharacterized protein N7515_008928 [Penicillium bovifimosum]KAJ5120967.1 hypothetical protein N7515_008928 [Penicillium bovifimosum]
MFRNNWILPDKPRRQLESLEWPYEDCVSDEARTNGQCTTYQQSQDEFHDVCEKIWASRGIICQLEEPGPNESGTVIAIQGKGPWMKEDHHHAAQVNPTAPLDHIGGISWKFWATHRFPPFLRAVSTWRVILSKTHGSWSARDTLPLHLIHHPPSGRLPVSALVRSFYENLAKIWDDVVHPHDQIQLIPNLPVINAYSCSVTSSPGEDSQTPTHTLLQCETFGGLRKKHFDQLHRAIGPSELSNYDSVVSNPLATRYVAKFMHQTGLLALLQHADQERSDDQPDENLEVMEQSPENAGYSPTLATTFEGGERASLNNWNTRCLAGH